MDVRIEYKHLYECPDCIGERPFQVYKRAGVPVFGCEVCRSGMVLTDSIKRLYGLVIDLIQEQLSTL